MNSRIRIAEKKDAAALLSIKDQLPLKYADGSTTTGGFLLGTDLHTYEHYIDFGFCLVYEVEEKVTGFGIILPDNLLRSSDVWQRRYQARWNIELENYETKQLCYFEQFAFLNGHRRAALLLAYSLVNWVFEEQYNTLFTTTVNKPVTNLAAIPFINAAAGIKAGDIHELYPVIGEIQSDIYLVESGDFYERTKAHPLYPYIQQHMTRFV